MNIHENFINIVSQIEREFDVNAIESHGIHLWPLIRVELVSLIIKKTKPPMTPTINSIDGLREKSALNKKKFHEFLNTLMPSQRDLDFLLISNENSTNKIRINNQSYMKFIDSFYDLYSSYFTIEHITLKNKREDFEHKNLVRYVDIISEVVRIESLLLFAQKEYKIKHIEEFIAYLKGLDIDLDVSYIEYRFCQLLSFIDCFRALLGVFNPKAVCLVCYYNIYYMAICHAARQSGIDTLELQHGVQNDFHYMYTNWSTVPVDGYSLIPNYFMMWDEASKKRVDKWIEKSSYHKAIVLGNLFVYNIKNIPKNSNNIQEHYPKDCINILLSLQTEPYYTKALTQAINKLTTIGGKKIVWHFKNHPIFEKDLFEKKIKPKLLKKVLYEYEYTNRHTIYDILEYVDINITAFSSTAKEFKELSQVPTIFTSSLGLKGEGFFHCYSAVSIMKKIQYIMRYKKIIQKEIQTSLSFLSIKDSITTLENI